MGAEEPALDQLLARAARGDQQAWRVLVDQYSGRVYGVLRAQGADPERAEEITQSVFCTVASKLATYVEQGHFESWLFRIAMNRLRDDARRRRRHARSVGDLEALDAMADRAAPGRGSGGSGGGGGPGSGGDGGGFGGLSAEESAALRAAMDRLSPADRQVVDLRHVGGLSFKQMSDVLGEPLGTLLARHHRALQKLRGYLEGTAGDPS
ncbi:MAG: RNA polymerase sigma factor [Phycisphaerales bacterium]